MFRFFKKQDELDASQTAMLDELYKRTKDMQQAMDDNTAKMNDMVNEISIYGSRPRKVFAVGIKTIAELDAKIVKEAGKKSIRIQIKDYDSKDFGASSSSLFQDKSSKLRMSGIWFYVFWIVWK